MVCPRCHEEKGTLAASGALALLTMIHKDVGDVLNEAVLRLRVDPDNWYVHTLITRLSGTTPRHCLTRGPGAPQDWSLHGERGRCGSYRGDVMLFRRWAENFSDDLAIDLGTANTLVFVRGEGIVLNEPSVVAIHETDHSVIAVGREAKAMLGRTPGNIRVIRPLKDGVIADFDITEKMLGYFISQTPRRHRTILRPRVVVGVPSDITQVERRAVRDAAMHAGARAVYLVEQPVAAAMGAGLQFDRRHRRRDHRGGGAFAGGGHLLQVGAYRG